MNLTLITFALCFLPISVYVVGRTNPYAAYIKSNDSARVSRSSGLTTEYVFLIDFITSFRIFSTERSCSLSILNAFLSFSFIYIRIKYCIHVTTCCTIIYLYDFTSTIPWGANNDDYPMASTYIKSKINLHTPTLHTRRIPFMLLSPFHSVFLHSSFLSSIHPPYVFLTFFHPYFCYVSLSILSRFLFIIFILRQISAVILTSNVSLKAIIIFCLTDIQCNMVVL